MKNDQNAQKLIVALDTPSLDIVKKLLKELKGVVSFYKIGFELFTAHGWEAVEMVRKAGGNIFLDLKLHDIPNTVAKTAAVLCEHEVEMFNVHTLGGFEMMKQVRETVDGRAHKNKKPLVLGVTILTSHSQETLAKDLRISEKIEDQVLHLASLAQKAGLDGVVCSPQEIQLLREKISKDFVIVTPGIRPLESAKDDQTRIMTPHQAIEQGASFIVVGRPINAAADPRQAALDLINSL